MRQYHFDLARATAGVTTLPPPREYKDTSVDTNNHEPDSDFREIGADVLRHTGR